MVVWLPGGTSTMFGLDHDKDGIDDAADHCPAHPETANNEYDLDGCPDPDKDQDYVLDYQDACPDAGLELIFVHSQI